MASIDKFIIEYAVELKDSLARIHRLKDGIKSVSQAANQSAPSLGSFVQGILGAKKGLEGMASGLDSAILGLSGLSGPAMVATAAILGVVAAVRQMNETLKEYNEQRKVAITAGMGYLGVESFQRNMAAASRGFVGGAESQNILRSVSAMGQRAYEDPYQMNREARILRMVGAPVTGPGGGIADTQDQIEAIGKHWATMTQTAARAQAQLLGISQNAADAIRDLGESINNMTHMSAAEAQRHAEATQASIKLQAAYNSLAESGRRLGDAFSDELLPIFASFMDYIAQLVSGFQKIVTNGLDWLDNQIRRAKGQQPMSAEEIARQEGEANRQQREMYSQMNRDINLFSSAVGTFAGVVDDKEAWAAWAGAVGAAGGLGGTEAGRHRLEPGETGGGLTVNTGVLAAAQGALPSSLAAPSTGGGTAEAIARIHSYDAMIEASAKANGVDPDDLRRLMFVESKGIPTADSGKATGLMQVTPANFQHYGVRPENYQNPAVNIETGAMIWADALKMAGGDKAKAAMIYNAGPKSSHWNNPETQAYPGLFAAAPFGAGASPAVNAEGSGMQTSSNSLSGPFHYAMDPNAQPVISFAGPNRVKKGYAGDKITGWTRDDILMGTTAGLLSPHLRGMSVSQILGGRVRASDIAYAASNVAAENMKARIAALGQLQALSGQGPDFDMKRGKLQADLRQADLNLINLTRYEPEIERGARQDVSRDVSIGDPMIQIVVNGVNDPKELVKLLQKELSTHIDGIVNGVSTNAKR
jgi:hypothetical protein